MDTLEGSPADAVDISDAGDGSVMGWLDDNNRLYIGGNGGVKAQSDCNSLFAFCTNIQIIDFLIKEFNLWIFCSRY